MNMPMNTTIIIYEYVYECYNATFVNITIRSLNFP